MPQEIPASFRVEPGSDERTFVLSGELDMASTHLVTEALEGLSGEGDVLFNLRELTFIDSSGIRALLQAADRVNGGKLILAHPTEAVLRVLDLVGLPEVSPAVVIQP